MKLRSLLLFSVIAAGAALDQLSKQWAELHVRPHGVITLVPGFLDLRYVRNSGAFFSLGSNLSGGVGRILLVSVTSLVLGTIVVLYHRSKSGQARLRWALSLLASGATGNLIDRTRSGEVVDFVHLHAGSVLRWATFNFADVLITFGLLLIVLDHFRSRSPAEQGRAGRLVQPAPTDGGY